MIFARQPVQHLVTDVWAFLILLEGVGAFILLVLYGKVVT